jgi:hypothetical protein
MWAGHEVSVVYVLMTVELAWLSLVAIGVFSLVR